MDPIVETPEPPYYAVVFTALHSEDIAGYQEHAESIYALATTMPGFIGMEAADIGKVGEMSVTYWQSEEAIRDWKANAEHLLAQKMGKERYYARYAIRVAKVERAYTFARPGQDAPG